MTCNIYWYHTGLNLGFSFNFSRCETYLIHHSKIAKSYFYNLLFLMKIIHWKIQRLPCKCTILISKFKSHLENWFKMCFDSSDLKTAAQSRASQHSTSGLRSLIIILSDWDNIQILTLGRDFSSGWRWHFEMIIFGCKKNPPRDCPHHDSIASFDIILKAIWVFVVGSQVHCQGLTAILTFMTQDHTIIKDFQLFSNTSTSSIILTLKLSFITNNRVAALQTTNTNSCNKKTRQIYRLPCYVDLVRCRECYYYYIYITGIQRWKLSDCFCWGHWLNINTDSE